MVFQVCHDTFLFSGCERQDLLFSDLNCAAESIHGSILEATINMLYCETA